MHQTETPEDDLHAMVPIGCPNPEAVLENIRLLDAFAWGHVTEADLVARACTLASDAPGAMAFVDAFRSITDQTLDNFQTIRLSGSPEREFLDWALVSVGELRGFLMDKPPSLHSYVVIINHGECSTCALAVRDDESGLHLWDSAVFALDAPVLALAVLSLHCRGVAYDVRPRSDVPDFGIQERLRESAVARQAFADPGPTHETLSAEGTDADQPEAKFRRPRPFLSNYNH